MKNISDKDFDLMVRSVMENAEEAVPDSLWDGISARLNVQGAKAPASHRLWRVGLALGLAGVCAAVILTIPRPVPVETGPQESITLADSRIEQSAAPVEIAVEPEPAPRQERIAVATAARAMAVDIPVQEQEAAPQEATPQQEIQQQEVPQQKAQQKTARKEKSPEYESLPRIPVQEHSHISRDRVQLTVLTGTGGNAGKHHYSIGRSSSRAIDFGGSRITENECTFVSIPVSVGVGVKIHFNSHWALGTGITYTYLGRKFSGTFDDGAVEKYSCPSITNDQHYLGIPVNLYFCFATANRLNFYAFAGGSVDKCISNRYWFNYAGSPMNLKTKVKGLQYSVTLGCGMQYDINDLLSIYLDPKTKYYFNSSSQPKSIRTTQPFQFGCELGLRFNL